MAAPEQDDNDATPPAIGCQRSFFSSTRVFALVGATCVPTAWRDKARHPRHGLPPLLDASPSQPPSVSPPPAHLELGNP